MTIRDPSDGTVREHRPEPLKTKVILPESDGLSTGPDTGVRQPTKTDAMERLEKSREFIRDYYAKKETRHDGGSNEQSAGDVQDRAGG